MTKRKPSVLSSNVPSTRDICDLLGFYGSEAQRSCKDSAKKWRKAYTSSDGHPGTELLDWNSTTDQEELKVMVVAFLFNAQKKELWKTLGVEPRPSYSDEMYAVVVFQWGLEH